MYVLRQLSRESKPQSRMIDCSKGFLQMCAAACPGSEEDWRVYSWQWYSSLGSALLQRVINATVIFLMRLLISLGYR